MLVVPRGMGIRLVHACRWECEYTLRLPWMTEPSGSEEAGFDPEGSGAGGLGSSSGMGLYQISPAGSPLLGVPGPKGISSGGLAPPSTHRRLLGSRLCR